MKDIHPQYFDSKANCACGNSWTTGGTVAEYNLDICSNCHPFYTGKQKTLDTRGRIDRFTKRMTLGEQAKAKAGTKKAKSEEATEKSAE